MQPNCWGLRSGFVSAGGSSLGVFFDCCRNSTGRPRRSEERQSTRNVFVREVEPRTRLTRDCATPSHAARARRAASFARPSLAGSRTAITTVPSASRTEGARDPGLTRALTNL